MRLLFVSSTITGGSGRSQRELAERLVRGGHQVEFLVDDSSRAPARRFAYEQLSDLAARLPNATWTQPLRWIEQRPGRRTTRVTIGGLAHLVTPVPQNALAATLDRFRPDVVIGNSLVRLTWRRIRAMCEERGNPTVLYVREVNSLDHLLPGELADAVVANARSLVAAVEERGVACRFIPSVINLELTQTATTRQVALMVNPIESHGIDLMWDLAARLPEVPFVLQESWPLSAADAAAVERRVDLLPNVELRRAQAPGPALYRDSRVLLAPHGMDNRPRVIAEAQFNGIPAIAAQTDGLAEAVGSGGLTIDVGDVDGWVDAIRMMFMDDDRYAGMSAAASEHSRRPELNPEAITATFEEVLIEATERRRRALS